MMNRHEKRSRFWRHLITRDIGDYEGRHRLFQSDLIEALYVKTVQLARRQP